MPDFLKLSQSLPYLGIGVSMAWSGFWSVIILKLLGLIFGGIRVPLENEREGLGWADHGEVCVVVLVGWWCCVSVSVSA